MKKIKRLCLWYALFTKRILKQKVFLAILLLIPLLAGGMRLLPSHNGGILTVAIARSGNDAFSADAVARLTDGKSVIHYRLYDTEKEATDAVVSGQCDAAWIFRENAETEAEKFAAGRSTLGSVTIVERESSVALMLSRECLFIAMYPYVSYGAYRDFLSDLSPEETVSEAELQKYYDTDAEKTPRIDYYYVDGTRQETGDLLLAPVRGLLSLIVFLSAIASAMIACRDEQRGTYAYLRGRKRAFVPLFSHITAIVPTAIASLAAIALCGLWTSWRTELLSMALYVLSVAAFCEVLRVLCRSEVTLGSLLPVLLTLMLVLCPIFLHIDYLHALQYSLPPYYYLHAAVNETFLPCFAVYALALLTLASAAAVLRKRTAE